MSVVGFAFKPFELVQKYLEKIAVIIVNGPLRGGNEPLCGMWLRLWNGAKVRFCTDGAANFLVDLCACNKITYPDFIVGDFDSITTQSIRFFSAKQRCELLRIVEQDTTDLTKTLRALMDNISLSSCLSGILLLGGFNGRFDHILGALNTLLLQVQTRRDLPIFAIEGSNVITVLPKGNTQVELSDQHITGICGIVPIVQRPTIVSSDGLKWELPMATIAGKLPPTETTPTPGPQQQSLQEPQQLTAKEKALHNYVFRSMKRAHDMFIYDHEVFPENDEKAEKIWRNAKIRASYSHVIKAVEEAKRRRVEEVLRLPKNNREAVATAVSASENAPQLAITAGTAASGTLAGEGGQLTATTAASKGQDNTVRALLPSRANLIMKPKWHAPWKLYRVISGHTGWVRAIDVEPNNEWFASGGADRIVKIWDLASGQLKLSLTGHISAVRAVKVSPRHPYLFSAGEDKQVKCWDLEQNKVVRHYHGHLSAVQDLALHPTLDILVTCARDSTARVWDMRTKAQIFCLSGHRDTVASVVCQSSNPQVITGSHDSTIRMWDLATGRSICTLTNHKKSVRSLAIHPTLNMFASGSTDNIKQWKLPNGDFIQNLSGHNTMINSLAINEDGVLVSGGDVGTMHFWDFKSGFCFQKEHPPAQPGSIDSERGIFALCFDKSGSRLITAEADKSIKMWKEDPEATEETHPLTWRSEILKKQRF